MKKIYSLMVAAVAMFAAASCTQELENNAPEAKGETVVYTASTDGADTKAVLNETTKKSEWVANDAITVLDGTKGWTFTTANAGANVDFSNSEGFGEYRPVLAVYPAAREGVTYTANVEAKTAKANIPTWQQAQAGTYHSSAALAVAYSEDNSFAFKNAHALLKFTVNTDNVTHVIFHGNGSEAITGDVYVTLGEEGVESVECLKTEFTEKKWNEETQQNEDVKVQKYGTWVECYAYHDDANKYFAKDQTYYIAVAPQKFEGGVTVKVRINEGEELVAKTTTKPVETKVNTILDLGEIEYEAPVVHEWAIAGTFNEWSTTANPMELVDGYYVAKNITGLNYSDPNEGETGSSTGIKFVNNGDWKGGEGQVTAGTWAYVWGDGGNIYVDGATADTAYDIYLNPSEGDYGKFVIVAAGATMPEDKPATAQEWYLVGDFNNWTAADANYKMALDGEWYVFENFTADGKKVKFVADADWKINRGGSFIANQAIEVTQDGSDISVPAGNYDVYLSADATIAYFMNPGLLPGEAPEPEQPEEVTPGQDSEWALLGVFSGWIDQTFVTTSVSNVVVLEDVKMKAAEGFLVRKPTTEWADKYGAGNVNYIQANSYITTAKDGGDMCLEADGTYDIYFNTTTKAIYVMTAGTDYTTAVEQTVSGKEPEVEEPEVTANMLYLKPNSNWMADNARFAAYFFGGTPGEKWVSMTDSDADGIYEVNIPEGYDYGCSVIFCRMNPNTTANNWNNKWNQTSDLTAPTDGKNLYTIDDGSWDKGTWSTRLTFPITIAEGDQNEQTLALYNYLLEKYDLQHHVSTDISEEIYEHLYDNRYKVKSAFLCTSGHGKSAKVDPESIIFTVGGSGLSINKEGLVQYWSDER